MSGENLLVDDEILSPDMFSDAETGANITDDSTSSASGHMAEPVNTYPDWKGISLDEICKGFSVFDFEHLPPIAKSQNHTVLFALPLPNRGAPKPYPSQPVDRWNQDYVRLPHSTHSRYPINKEDEPHSFRQRWEVIQEALLQSFYSSRQLEQAIFSYNHKYAQRWDFRALHHFFSKVVDEQEAQIFFNTLLPKIISLALQLPELVTGGIPLLKRNMNASISLSQLQVASLLANAFLCTFPRRNSSNPQSEYANFPHINFNRLFSAMMEKRSNRTSSVMEKLKCIFHYFRRVTSNAPTGTITIQRKYIPKESCPQWKTRDERLPLLHITSKGTIEREGAGLLQVDFANKFVGGGVMNFGCVQEEIRFVICPELFVTMLVSEVLDDTEALVVCGVEQYSKYEGYSDSFQWAGDFVDETPRDNSGRRKTCIVAIDALRFSQPKTQFNTDKITRELNKAYVGFYMKEMPADNLCAVATGNWGCGAFRGNPKLKVLLQLIAAAVAKRSIVYFTFGDTELRDSVAEMYWFLVGQNLSIGELFDMICSYNDEEKTPKKHSDFYRFLYNKSKMKGQKNPENNQPKLNFFRKQKSPKKLDKEIKSEKSSIVPFEKLSEKERNDVLLEMLEKSDDEEDVIEKTPEKKCSRKDRERKMNGFLSNTAEDGKENKEKESKEIIEKTENGEKEEIKNCENGGQFEKEKSDFKIEEDCEDRDSKRRKINESEMENEKSDTTERDEKSSLNEISNRNIASQKNAQRKISDFFTPVR